MNIAEQSWEEVQFRANTILNAYRPNNKDTFQIFFGWTEDDKNFIAELSSILGYSKFEKKTNAYINHFMKIFFLANELVGQYNRPIASDGDLLRCYDACVDRVLKTDYEHYKEYASQLKKWYRSYRGMSHLTSYNKDLKHEQLLERTQQLIRTTLLSDFINNPSNNIAQERPALVAQYSNQLQLTLETA